MPQEAPERYRKEQKMWLNYLQQDIKCTARSNVFLLFRTAFPAPAFRAEKIGAKFVLMWRQRFGKGWQNHWKPV